MNKLSSVGRTALAILIGFVLMAVVGAQNRFAASAESHSYSAKLISLKLTFSDGQWARVSEFEGGTIRIEENGNVLALTPYTRAEGSDAVELKVFRALKDGGRETMQAVASLSVGKTLAKVDSGGMAFSVQVKEAGRIVSNVQGTTQCCTTDCNGRLICGVCVCTPCGVCAAQRWCDCPAPAPAE